MLPMSARVVIPEPGEILLEDFDESPKLGELTHPRTEKLQLEYFSEACFIGIPCTCKRAPVTQTLTPRASRIPKAPSLGDVAFLKKRNA
jgi:hypothetical protein